MEDASPSFNLLFDEGTKVGGTELAKVENLHEE
jgi:hypothetical protein